MSFEEEGKYRAEKQELGAVAERIMQHKFNNNPNENFHKTALFYVILCEQFETAKQLISFGADVRVKNDLGQTPLQYAVTQLNCNPRFSEYAKSKLDYQISCYIAMGAVSLSTMQRMGAQSQSKLTFRNSAARLSLVKMLLKAGSDVNNKDYCGCSPIHCAVYTGDLDLLKTLIDAGADINSRNDAGATALHDAICCSQEATVRLLLRSGARVDIKTLDGNTPLHWAALLNRNYGPAGIIKALLNYPVDVNCRNHNGQTPFHYIMCNFDDDPDMVGRFMELKADINAKDINGATPFSLNEENVFDPELPALPVNIRDRRIIIERVAAMEAKAERPVFDDYNLSVINKNSAIRSYYEKCRIELEAMREKKFNDSSLTYLKILTEPFKVLARYARDKELLKRAVEEFPNRHNQNRLYPIYGSRLRAKLNTTAARRKMVDYKLRVVDQVSRILSRAMQFDASDVLFEIVVKYLSKDDTEHLLMTSAAEELHRLVLRDREA